jgi:hypothetical protein
MALLSLARDAVPAWAKIDLQLHRPYRTWFGLGRSRCEWCGERWGRHGCPMRESAAKLFVYTATAAQKTAAIDSGELTADDLKLRRRRPVRHRRKPSPFSLAASGQAVLTVAETAATDRSVVIRRGGHCFRFVPDLGAGEVRIMLLFRAETAPVGVIRSLRASPTADLAEGCPAELRADALRLAREVFFRADFQQSCFDQAVAGIRARMSGSGFG